MSDPEKLRLFVAVDIPPAHLQAVERGAASCRQLWPHGRWTPVENQHVTLKFLGWTPAERLAEIERVVEGVAGPHPPARIRLTGLGCFPGGRRMRVLWVGMDDPSSLLAGVAGDLDQALEPLGYPVEDRAFTPHLTLARFKAPVRLTEELPDVSFQDLDPFFVDRLHLYRSRLHPKGARYQILKSFDLRGDEP